MAEKPLPFPLSSPDKTVGNLLNESVALALSRLAVDKTLFDGANAFLLELTGQTVLYGLLRVEGIELYRDKVFTSENNRDLVFAIYSNFIARYSVYEEDITALHEMIARAANISDKNASANNMPEVLRERLPTYEEIQEQLQDNPWLVSLSLVILYWNHGMAMTHARG